MEVADISAEVRNAWSCNLLS